MKKVIRKKVYDTETGELINQKNVGVFGDPDGYSEVLYKNENGFYFLHTMGGAESIYIKEDIKSVSAVSADKWLAETKE